MTLELAIQLFAALGGMGAFLSGCIYGVARWVRSMYQERLTEKDVEITRLRAKNDEAGELLRLQNISQQKQIDAQAALIAAMRELPKGTGP